MQEYTYSLWAPLKVNPHSALITEAINAGRLTKCKPRVHRDDWTRELRITREDERRKWVGLLHVSEEQIYDLPVYY